MIDERMSNERMSALLQPYLPGDAAGLPPELVRQLQAYLELLLRWNERTNLTAVRDAESIVARHFGESLFAAAALSPRLEKGATLFDFGSGAGFPGLPIQLYRPDLRVTLAESQNKKATFLREVIRVLGLPTAIHAARAETMPRGTKFDCITLRAVDDMQRAITAAMPLLGADGCMALLTTPKQAVPLGLVLVSQHAVPNSSEAELRLYEPAR